MNHKGSDQLIQIGREAVSSTSSHVKASQARAGSSAASRSVPQNKLEALLVGPKETRLAVGVVIVAFVLVTLVMFNAFFKSAAPAVSATSPQTLPVAGSGIADHSAATQAVDSTAVTTDANQPARMNQTPASQIDLSMIDRITGKGNSSIIFFKDGSNMTLDPYTMEQLPRAIQLRVSYVQGPQGQAQPPETRRPPGAANAR
jgi:hypothetical protein